MLVDVIEVMTGIGLLMRMLRDAEPGPGGETRPHGGLGGGQRGRRHPLRARQQNDLRAAECADRLAQGPRRQEPPVAERRTRIQQDQVHVTRQPSMLEAIVQQQQIGPAGPPHQR